MRSLAAVALASWQDIAEVMAGTASLKNAQAKEQEYIYSSATLHGPTQHPINTFVTT